MTSTMSPTGNTLIKPAKGLNGPGQRPGPKKHMQSILKNTALKQNALPGLQSLNSADKN